ncbi:MAG: KaiC domain-containing protein [Armatimonadetes bacterium]|nr:KaiC domain-containing protein [Armatimonadota bacterium]MCX7969445.1 KaiC domain-containing protein [Armatimonadota bacterium]MDW8141965.1 KaiC domain-containing protein [Armatimonadota bacterium]
MARKGVKPKTEEEIFAAEATEGLKEEVKEGAEEFVREEYKPVVESLTTLREAGKRAPKLFGIASGVEGLDNLFFTTEIQDGRPVKRPLGGFPSYAVVNITGVPDTGKSLMVEQFAVKQASMGYPVLFVTIESPAPFVASGLKQRATAMGIDYELVQDKIVLVDAASYSVLRHSLPTLLNTLAHAIKTYETKSLVVDSITGLYEAREMMARDIVRMLFNFAKKWRQTALFVSQKRSSHEQLSPEAAGGYAVSHIVDCSIVLSKVLITNRFEAKLYKAPVGEVVRLFRIDGCRLCGHDTKTHLMEITETGLVRIGQPLSAEVEE